MVNSHFSPGNVTNLGMFPQKFFAEVAGLFSTKSQKFAQKKENDYNGWKHKVYLMHVISHKFV